MEALWRESPVAADELVARVKESTSWGEATIRTLIHRLLKKGALRSERAGGRHRYHPALDRSDYVDAESRNFLERLFQGELSPLVSHFAERRNLSPEDVRRLRALVEALDE